MPNFVKELQSTQNNACPKCGRIFVASPDWWIADDGKTWHAAEGHDLTYDCDGWIGDPWDDPEGTVNANPATDGWW